MTNTTTRFSAARTEETAAIPWYSWLLLLFLSLMWGSSYILIKKALGVFSPLQVGALRLSISGLAFLPYLLWQWRKVDWRRGKWLVLVGLTGTALPSVLFPLAQTHISSSVSGMLNSMTPLFTLLIGIIVFRSPVVWAKIAGVLLGLAGAVLLILSGNDAQLGKQAAYGLFIVLATLCYATSTNTVAFKLRGMNALVISGVSFAMVGLPAILLAAALGVPAVVEAHPEAWTALGYIAILALGSTVLAGILFFHLIQVMGPIPSSMVSYIVPVVALFWGIADGELIGFAHLLGMSLILAGVYLSRRKR